MNENITFFFRNPNNFISQPQKYSTLFLLHRDVLTCFGFNPNNGERIEYEVIFPGLMTICSGFDLLSKFYSGNDNFWEAGKRFKCFIADTLNLNQQDSELLWSFRNSMLHSFGLYGRNNNTEYKFVLNGNGENIINKTEEPNKYFLNIYKLFKGFQDSIQNYYELLKADIQLENNFNKMFENYGYVDIQ